MSTAFPTGFADLPSVTGSTKLLADNGTVNGLASVDQVLNARIAAALSNGYAVALNPATGKLESTGLYWDFVNGHVGIGTTTPSGKMHVDGGNLHVSNASTNAASTGAAKGLSLGFDGNLEHGWIQSVRNNASEVRELELQPLGGNVGIQLTDPRYGVECKDSIGTRAVSFATLPNAARADGQRHAIVDAPVGRASQVKGNAAAGGGTHLGFVYSEGGSWYFD